MEDLARHQLQVYSEIRSDLDFHVGTVWIGKSEIKKLKVSPDAFYQLGLQLAYFRTVKKFGLTYESTITMLYKKGRTETIRSNTQQSCAFVNAMENQNFDRNERKKV